MGLGLRSLIIGFLLATASPREGVYAQEESSSSKSSSLESIDTPSHEPIASKYTDPSTGDPSILIAQTQRLNNQTLLWGPYRPQVYFGIKPRLPDSFIGGLMWAGVNDYQWLQKNFRHTCEQGDEVDGYGWVQYDVRTGGTQKVADRGNGVDLVFELRKVEGGQHGGHWGVRVKGTPRRDAPKDVTTALWFYAGLEGEGDINLVNEENYLGLEGDVTLAGQAPGLGKFKLTITEGPETNQHPLQEHQASLSKPLDRTLYKAFVMPFEHIWKTKADILFMHIQENLNRLMKEFGRENHPPAWDSFTLENVFEEGNLHMVQKTFVGAFEFDILYTSESAETPMTSDLLTQKILEFKETFPERFSAAFKLQPPFNTHEYTEFAQTMFSNLIGGIGYFHGTTLVDRSNADEYAEEDEEFWEGASAALKNADVKTEGPFSLFTSIPSRPFFPRGFYWDEGFQLLPMLEWDVDLALEIIKSWFSLVDEDGWIAREQILGDEARSKVPSEFQVQYPHHANPPTLFIAITEFPTHKPTNPPLHHTAHIDHQFQQILGGTESSSDMRTAHLSPPLAINFLQSIYPLLRRHFYWFRRTQLGDLKSFSHNAPFPKEAFRWRGRTPTHCLASGLDDYPRATPPHTGELHVDLISWMSVMTRCLRKIAVALDSAHTNSEEPSPYAEDIATFITMESHINKNLDALHWSAEENLYCDVTIDTDYEEPVHSCHPGYISLFPLLVGGIIPPDSPRLPHLLRLITDPNHLASPYGIRSLSPKSPMFAMGENYWRGPIWININYLVLVRLLEYARVPGPNQKVAREAYLDLRKKVVRNVYKEWKRTGFAWEQYDEGTGEGRRTKHFLGWTSLVVKIMGMPGEVALVQKEYVDWAV
ncbi:mannosyl-oligosaccharide glucosidase [Terfezia boudieri ATCC MYA-4762]|uniref:Mannosyl-oligosaccharide glucosidase n=1 Tax=Terfezia boudieri ATCC MYA-4762 TaxID=1051890 RepID=A0A3N4LXL5_9PEZI|nr:mannosyl-oligosaccharide glucosidase [Terfezia boudieri ATCC MYA-4762]